MISSLFRAMYTASTDNVSVEAQMSHTMAWRLNLKDTLAGPDPEPPHTMWWFKCIPLSKGYTFQPSFIPIIAPLARG